MSYVAGRAEELPIRAGSFDLLTVSLTFHWLDRERFLPEALRVLNRHGRVVVYDNFFAGRAEEGGEDGMGQWMRDVYWKRYPYPSRFPLDFTAGDLVEPGFRCEMHDEYQNLVEFTRERLVDYLVTQTNVIAAVEEGDECIDDVRGWLLCELASFFEGRESRRFIFECPIWILRPTRIGGGHERTGVFETGDVRIREATEADALAVGEVHSSAIQAIDRSLYSDREIASWGGRVNPERWQDFPEILTKSVFLVAEQGVRLVGFAQLVTDEREVRAVYVRPDVGGQGIGSALLAQIETAARNRKIDALELKASLNAVPFYRGHGYEQLEETTHRLADGVELRCIRMRKTL